MRSKEPAKLKVVLDTSVLVAAVLSRSGGSARVLELLLAGKVHGFRTDETVEELKQVLRRKKFGLDREVQDHFVHVYTEASFRVEPIAELAVVRCRDPKDDKFLSLARQVEADCIVSLDDDLLALGSQGSAKILKPGVFLKELI